MATADFNYLTGYDGFTSIFPESRFFYLDRRDLDHILDVLNWKPKGGMSPYREELIRLLEKLKGCGDNLQKMMHGDPELAEVVAKVCRTRWVPSRTGRAYLVPEAVQEEIQLPSKPGQMVNAAPERMAALLFHVGTINPEWNKLAGPCARCGTYYLKNGHHRTFIALRSVATRQLP